MTPEQFVGKWRNSTRTEKSAAHEHFLDLCELLDVKKPAESDPHGTKYTFGTSALMVGGASGMPTFGVKCLLSPPGGRHRRLYAAMSGVEGDPDVRCAGWESCPLPPSGNTTTETPASASRPSRSHERSTQTSQTRRSLMPTRVSQI